jgi:hypothetical protein
MFYSYSVCTTSNSVCAPGQSERPVVKHQQFTRLVLNSFTHHRNEPGELTATPCQRCYYHSLTSPPHKCEPHAAACVQDIFEMIQAHDAQRQGEEDDQLEQLDLPDDAEEAEENEMDASGSSA